MTALNKFPNCNNITPNIALYKKKTMVIIPVNVKLLTLLCHSGNALITP